MCNGSMKPDSERTLKDSNVCPICHGNEWILETVDGIDVAKPCKCRSEAIKARRIRFAELPEGFSDKRLKTFSLGVYKRTDSKDKARIACMLIKEYLNMLEAVRERGMGLYIYSATKGSGKTRMAASIANELMDKGISVKFSTSTRILNEIRSTYDKESRYTESQLMNALITAPVLIIDDFGTENITPWVRDKVYDIVNERYINKRITIFTSNESLKESSHDERITNRIKEMCYQIDFPEESVREHIAEKNMEEIMGRAFGGSDNENISRVNGDRHSGTSNNGN